VLTPERDLPRGSVLVANGRIEWVRRGDVRVPGARVLSRVGDVIAPGFIDLQVNGLLGKEASRGAEHIAAISSLLPAYGVTAFLPTATSRPLEEAVRFVRDVAVAEAPGARVLGAHLEGPFLNPKFRGAHDESFLLRPTSAALRQILRAPPRMITLAPELPGALRAIRELAAAGTLVSAGHSGASYAEAIAAIAAGVRFGTHIFNAMSTWHHREPGLPGALMGNRDVVVGLIADGVHVHPAMASTVIRACGAERVALTTDQTAVAGRPAGSYVLEGRSVRSDRRAVWRSDGMLAGSASTMDRLVRFAAALPNSGLRDAVLMASLSPACALGLDRRVGRIDAGYDADIVVLRADARVRITIVGGRLAYRQRS
jgi:N-acetylglucosamine-6-phosphate deacetylase